MKRNRILGLMLLMILLLVGCGNSAEVKENTLILSDEENVSYVIISDFSEPYYNLDELKVMAQKEIDTYGSGVQIGSTEVTDGVLNFQYVFDSLSHYAKFMETSCYKSSVSNALANGYKADTKLVSAKNSSSTITMNDRSIGERNLFVWNENIAARCDGNVLYYSENLTLTGKTDVKPKDGSVGPYYVVYK